MRVEATRRLSARRCRRGAACACALACGVAGLSFLAPRPLAPAAAEALRVSTASRGLVSGAARGAEGSQLAPLAAAILGLGAARGAQLVGKSLVVRRGGDGGDIEDVVPFEIRGFSLSQVFLAAGALITIFSFGDYFILGSQGGGFGIGGLTFVYAPVVLLLGAALTYAELLPVEVETDPDAVGLFDEKATDTLKKVKKDVTRHRYGDDAHLDSSLKALGLQAASGRYPQMKKIIESKTTSGELEFRMLFESKDVPFTIWNDPMKIVACDRFFGPGVWTEIKKYDAGKRIAELKLTTGSKPGAASD